MDTQREQELSVLFDFIKSKLKEGESCTIVVNDSESSRYYMSGNFGHIYASLIGAFISETLGPKIKEKEVMEKIVNMFVDSFFDTYGNLEGLLRLKK